MNKYNFSHKDKHKQAESEIYKCCKSKFWLRARNTDWRIP
ncbi:hypothetical protein MNBD_GAMMA21-2951 [hydrothermal vent metagenome]|uniref:Uncharacterized protein n=1 Tax=hydrothermal vent metagenome TaxID=652676 RepID=A0A3B1AHH3_9ZZZZ